jgi:tRNA pseudouridine55 synthase
VMRLGISTDTQDLTGTAIHERDYSSVDRAALEDVLRGSTGCISQIPPMFSAIKQNGQPLYKLARQGLEVERQPRAVEIHSLELTSFQPPLVSFRVTCSRGTYVRTLADDIGTALGCGAALKELRRTASGRFGIASACTLEALEEAVRENRLEELTVTNLMALSHLNEIPLSGAGFEKLQYGRAPSWPDCLTPSPLQCASPQLVTLSFAELLAAVATVVPSSTDGVPGIVLKRVFV